MPIQDEYIVWQTGVKSFRLSDNFFSHEFETDDLKPRLTFVSLELVRRLQLVRNEFRKALGFTSAFRSQDFQDQLKAQGFPTAAGISPHEYGRAVDIDTSLMSAKDKELLLSILAKHFKAIGIAKNFIHVDLRDDKPRVWKY